MNYKRSAFDSGVVHLCGFPGTVFSLFQIHNLCKLAHLSHLHLAHASNLCALLNNAFSLFQIYNLCILKLADSLYVIHLSDFQSYSSLEVFYALFSCESPSCIANCICKSNFYSEKVSPMDGQLSCGSQSHLGWCSF